MLLVEGCEKAGKELPREGLIHSGTQRMADSAWSKA